MSKNLYALVGRSGTGKSAVMTWLCNEFGFIPVESYTDRPRRFTGERGHRFVTKAEFDSLSPLLLPTTFAGARYGVTEQLLDKSSVLILDPKGIFDLRRHYAGHRPLKVIGIHASFNDLEARMLARGDDRQSVFTRLEHDETVFGMMDDLCDIIVVNRDITETKRVVAVYIDSCENDR